MRLEADAEPPSSLKLCWDSWSDLLLVLAVLALVPVGLFIVLPFLVITILDCLGGWCCGSTSGCCTDCCLEFFPVCTSKDCLEGSRCSKYFFPLIFDSPRAPQIQNITSRGHLNGWTANRMASRSGKERKGIFFPSTFR